VVLNLAKAQAESGEDVSIWCLDDRETADVMADAYGLEKGRILVFPTIGPRSIGFSFALIVHGLLGPKVDILHQHGIWTAVSLATFLTSKIRRCPAVVAPHGSLQSKVLRKSYAKKRLASLLYEDLNLKNAVCLHATTEQEIGDFRRYGLENSIALVMNGISNSWLASCGNGAAFIKAHGLPSDKRIALFMSRIAPKKGLPLLIQAFEAHAKNKPEWVLVVVGGDEDGHKREVMNLVERLGLEGRVFFVNPVFGQAKRDAFAAAELFILPSHSEGFPMVVLDSLGAGVPAIVTKASAWKDLETFTCGWWVDDNKQGIGAALASAMSCTKCELADMGTRGKKLVEDRYNWRSLSARIVEVYCWMSGRAALPGHLIYDLRGVS
jgi:Glycosyltransferase